MTVDEVLNLCNKKSGLIGISGISSDMRDIDSAADAGDENAILARDMLVYSVRKYIGAYAAVLGGVDAIAFTGGIGENSALVRKKSLQGLDYMGVLLDESKNESAVCDCQLTAPEGRVRLFAIAANEELVVARKAKAYLERR